MVLRPILFAVLLFSASARAQAEKAAPIAHLDLASVKKQAEVALQRKYGESKPGEFRLQYAYFKVDPNKPVNDEVVVAVYLRDNPREIKREDLGAMARITTQRDQVFVELDPEGRLIR